MAALLWFCLMATERNITEFIEASDGGCQCVIFKDSVTKPLPVPLFLQQISNVCEQHMTITFLHHGYKKPFGAAWWCNSETLVRIKERMKETKYRKILEESLL